MMESSAIRAQCIGITQENIEVPIPPSPNLSDELPREELDQLFETLTAWRDTARRNADNEDAAKAAVNIREYLGTDFGWGLYADAPGCADFFRAVEDISVIANDWWLTHRHLPVEEIQESLAGYHALSVLSKRYFDLLAASGIPLFGEQETPLTPL